MFSRPGFTGLRDGFYSKSESENGRFGDLFFGGVVMDELDFVSWKIVQWVLWAGPLGIAAFLAACFFAGYFLGRWASRRKPKEIAMGHGIPMHVKLDINPDGSTTPPDIFN